MNPLDRTTWQKTPAHLIGWAIFFVAPLLLSPGPAFSSLVEPNILFPTLLRNLILMALFYVNLLYLTPVVLKTKGLIPFLLSMVVAIIVVSMVNDWIHMTYTEHFERPPFPPDQFRQGPPRHRPMMLAGPLLSSFLITIMIASVSTSIVFWNDWNKARADEQERALQKVASELAVLKLQVSPHFLFNTLNNIRWLVRSRSDRAEEAVVKLSQLLRYILYQTNQEFISLEKEIDNLRDYVSLQHMRLEKPEAVDFQVHGNVKDREIIPLLFIPLAENFFKHGDFDGSFQNVIRMTLSDDRLVFQTVNKILPDDKLQKEGESGIGLKNVEKRLALHYPGKHVMRSWKEKGVFYVTLEILLS